jgi:hypothetical protein
MYLIPFDRISSYKLEDFPRHLNVMHVEQEVKPQDKPALEVVMVYHTTRSFQRKSVN